MFKPEDYPLGSYLYIVKKEKGFISAHKTKVILVKEKKVTRIGIKEYWEDVEFGLWLKKDFADNFEIAFIPEFLFNSIHKIKSNELTPQQSLQTMLLLMGSPQLEEMIKKAQIAKVGLPIQKFNQLLVSLSTTWGFYLALYMVAINQNLITGFDIITASLIPASAIFALTRNLNTSINGNVMDRSYPIVMGGFMSVCGVLYFNERLNFTLFGMGLVAIYLALLGKHFVRRAYRDYL